MPSSPRQRVVRMVSYDVHRMIQVGIFDLLRFLLECLTKANVFLVLVRVVDRDVLMIDDWVRTFSHDTLNV